MKKWLIIGAGAAGRGIIASFAAAGGFQIIFAEYIKETTDFLKKQKRLEIRKLQGKRKKDINIFGFEVLNTQTEEDKIIERITHPELQVITTSVRKENLPFVAPLVAKGLKLRVQKKLPPILVIPAENYIGGGKEFEKMCKKYYQKSAKIAEFSECLIDSIVPDQNPLSKTIKREFHCLMYIEAAKLAKKYLKNIPDLILTKRIADYQQLKILGVNGLHLCTALLGLKEKKKYVYESVKEARIKRILNEIISELKFAISKICGFSQKEVEKYLKKVLRRFGNRALPDENLRIIRNLGNKLNAEERLLKPALELYSQKKSFKALKQIIALGLARCIKFDLKEKNIKIPELVKKICQIPKKAKGLEKEIISLIEQR